MVAHKQEACLSADHHAVYTAVPAAFAGAATADAAAIVIRWSSEYAQLQDRFHQVQATADPNNLALMLAQSPHHADALLQLAMVFAHTGQMDKASEFVRRYYILSLVVPVL